MACNHPQKGVNYHFSRPHLDEPYVVAFDFGSLNMQYQQDWPKDYKNYSFLNFLQENLEKFRAKICNFSKIEAKIEK